MTSHLSQKEVQTLNPLRGYTPLAKGIQLTLMTT